MIRILSSLLICLVVFTSNAFAQSEKISDADARQLFYMIYDSSNSMWGELSDKSRKYEAGRTAMSSVLDLNLADRDLAFRAYGHRDKTDCRDSELIVSASSAKTAKPLIKNAVTGIRPTGKTPITHSLREALKDMGNRKGDILLISDGIETCDIDPCALMAEWRNQGIKIRVHVVGVGLNDIERKAMMCVAETGGGEYYDAGSEGELIEAMNKATKIEPGEPKPIKQVQGYGLNIKGADKMGRSFIITGHLYDEDGKEVITLTSNGQQWVEKPGKYTMKVGVLLKDGSIYKPVDQAVEIVERGITRANVLITRPAIVSASFAEDGEKHRGAHVNAYQNGKMVFSFRSFDEALARPGTYEFRSNPNDDNELRVEGVLTEGEHTVIDFKLVKTVQFLIKYILPNGETDQRSGKLFKDDKPLYTTYVSNYTTAIPGTYELRNGAPGSHVLNPLPARTMVTITDEKKQTIEVQMSVGYILAEYEGEKRDILSNNGYIWAHALDENGKSTGSKILNSGRASVARPGTYRLLGRSDKGYYDPVEITIEHDKTTKVAIVAKPTAHISMTYAQSYDGKTPNRASLQALDGQKPIKSYMRPGKVLKVPPGRYRIKPQSFTGITAPEFEVKAGETKAIVLE